MNSRVSWSVEGIEPSVRERAEAAARRAGMSLGDWLNSTIGDQSPSFRVRHDSSRDPARPSLPERDAREVAEIHQRLDAINRQIEQISRPSQHAEPGVARQLNDAISRLDARLSQITEPTPPPTRSPEMVERAAAQVYSSNLSSASPPLSPDSLDFAIAEITARQNHLDGVAPRQMPPRYAPPTAPAMAPPPGPDLSALERQLFKITNQIDALQRPNEIDQSIALFRSELAEIRNIITEAMPRRAIESIENEIRSLSKRIDDSRQGGIDGRALAGVERALGEIREALRALTPAEQLAGFDDAIRNLGGKIDLIVRSSDDPGTLRQLEDAITALRAIVSNVASNEALSQLRDDVHMLASKVDQLARSDDYSDSFAALEQRIATLTSTLENRERPIPSDSSGHIEGALRALSDRLDHLPVGNDSSSAFAHLEQRVSLMLERLEAFADPRANNLGRVEEGLQDVLRQLERQQSNLAALSNSRNAPASMDPALVDAIKRELSDMRFSQTETDRHTQDSLEVVHNTLGHVVDRLALIEGDLRAVRSAPPAAVPPQAPASRAATVMQPPSPRPELPNPVQSQPQSRPAAPPFDSAPRNFAQPQAAPEPSLQTPKAIGEILGPPAAAARTASTSVADARPSRAALPPDLPPDHPLEPGSRPPARVASPSERIAASEEAISEISTTSREQATASSFIAAARRAAQAAAAAPGSDKNRGAKPGEQARDGKNADKAPAAGASSITSKIRSLLVGASVVVIVLGSFKMAMTLLDASSPPAAEVSSDTTSQPLPPAETQAQPAPAAPAPVAPSMTSPTPIGRQSLNAPAPQPASPNAASTPVASLPIAPAAVPPAPDVTGSIAVPQAGTTTTGPSSNRKLAIVPIPVGERLPDTIGGPVLRGAALKGDAAAAYEVGVRYAEGKGVTANYDEAAKWYARAAQAGVVPALFRLGTLYEKGLSVKKDLDTARRYYMQAAERGNAKAMHNLAVLDADGGTKGANYKSASVWFRKAAERGVADSQFNLGILYARGIGVDQNLAESFKWFSLAAAQGDADSGRKRDDIAKRLDPQSLAAAKLAVQTFSAESQPDDAVNVPVPAGGWDSLPAQASAKTASGKRASAR